MLEPKSIENAIFKWQKRFMHRRQAPQEILETNEIVDEEGDEGEGAEKKGKWQDNEKEEDSDSPSEEKSVDSDMSGEPE